MDKLKWLNFAWTVFLTQKAFQNEEKDRTPLHYAAMNGHSNVVWLFGKKYQKDPSKINAMDKHGDTPLHLASYNGHLGIVHYLIEQGAFVDEKSIEFATQGGHWDLVEFFDLKSRV